VEEGVKNAWQGGVYFGFPLADVEVAVLDWKCSPDLPETAARACATDAVRNLAMQAAPQLLEPIMKVELTVDEQSTGAVISDLTSHRRGIVKGLQVQNHMRILDAEVPLREMVDYSTAFRSLTRGNGWFDMQFLQYGDIPATQQTKLLSELRGGL
jgi:elongation factor G